MADIEQAVGQYLVYRSWLQRIEPSREIFLAISDVVAEDAFDDLAGQALIQDYQLRIIVVDMTQKEIVQWIS